MGIIRKLTFFIVVLAVPTVLFAEERFKRESLEIGFERYWATVPYERAIFNSLLLNYFPTRNFYIGTSQSSLTWKNVSEYRPDFHIGFLFPFAENLALETTVGMDFFTALIIALALLDEKDSLDYKFVGSFYSPYFTLSTALRISFDQFALKLISQVQFGGYFLSETSSFNASIWLGLGATVRFDFY